MTPRRTSARILAALFTLAALLIGLPVALALLAGAPAHAALDIGEVAPPFVTQNLQTFA